MIQVNDVNSDFERAVNFLNFDKRGNPNGMDSLGIMLKIDDAEEHDLFVFIGLKFDVLSVYTNRGASFFINIEEDKKQFLTAPECYTEQNADEEIEFFVDVHKFNLNMRQLYSYVYGCEESKQEFNTMLENKVFKTFGSKTARAITMHPTRQFEGNLESIGFVLTATTNFFAANELLVEERSIADEILFTNWFVPRELEAYKYNVGNNELTFEDGDEFVDGLAGIVLTAGENINSFSYDRRGFRNGYMDLTQKDPFVNVGYRLGALEHAGTYFTRDREVSDIDLKKSRFSVEKVSSAPWINRVFQLVSLNHVVASSSRSELAMRAETFKYMINSVFGSKGKNSWVDSFTIGDVKNIISDAVNRVGNSNISSEMRTAAEIAFRDTFVQFLYGGNILRIDTDVTIADLADTVVFIYHPVLNKYFFYEVDGVSDSGVTIDENNNVIVSAHGFEYGFKSDGEVGTMLWSNIEKLYRDRPLELTFNNAVMANPDRNYTYSLGDPFTDNKDTLGTFIPGYEDLVYENKASFSMAIKKDDLLDIISKQYGVCNSNYVMGIKYGYMEVS